MIRVTFAWVVALLMAGCADQAHEMLGDARHLLTKDITDPHSVRYEALRVVQHREGTVLCGTINWKSGFDTYVGAKRFFYLVNTRGGTAYGIEGQELGGMVATYCD